MRHLKKFNESNNDYYSSISFAEMQELRSHNRCLFTGGSFGNITGTNNNEVKSIVSRVEPFPAQPTHFFWELYYKVEGNKNVGVETIEFRDRQYRPSNVKFYISKYEDEWYGVEYYHLKGYKAVALKYQISYYKCDQLEGLFKFLDDIKKPLN